MIARRAKRVFSPSDVNAVRRRFAEIVRKAMHKAENPALRTPLKPSMSSLTRQRRTA